MKRLAVFLFAVTRVWTGRSFPEAWPSYNGDTSGRRYSTLSKINQSNIDSLSLAWVYRVNPGRAPQAGGGNVNTTIKGTPVVVDGVLYTTIPDHVWAIDARTGSRDLALRVAVERRLAHRQSRRGGAARNGVRRNARLQPGRAELERREGKVAHPDLRPGAVLLRLRRAHHREESRDHRRQRRRSGYSRLHRIARSGHGRAPMALVRASRARNARSEDLAERRSHAARRRHDLGAQHLRSRSEPAVLRHRESAAGDRRARPRGIESVYRVHHRAQSRYGEARVVFPAVAARHARLGRGADAGVIRCATSTGSSGSCWRRPAATDGSSCSTAPRARTS